MIRLFNKNILVILLAIYIVVGFSLNQPINAQTTYPVSEKYSKYPLRTRISPAEIAEFEKIFQFGKFEPKKAIALRKRLQPLANANDPVASYWLGKTYDWYEFGAGKESERPLALKWYSKAAELNYIPAIYFLYQTYFYGFMGLEKNDSEAFRWLLKAKKIADGKEKSYILKEFARLSDPAQDDMKLRSIPKNLTAHLEYLRQAYTLNPRELADYYGDSLYKTKRYIEALTVLSHSDNPYTWRKLGQMYEQGLGTSKANIVQALFWYKKMATDARKYENHINPISMYGRLEIYRLLCLKKITEQQAAPIYTPKSYQEDFERWSDAKCNFNPG